MPDAPPETVADFSRAVREEDIPAAIDAIRRLERVRLHQALALTLLLARQDDSRIEGYARRFLCRYIEEIRPSLGHVAAVAERLDRLLWFSPLRDLEALDYLREQLEARGL